MKKRVLSLFMALVLCVSLAPTTVLATTGIDADSNVESADNNEKSADSNKNVAGTGAADAKDEENAGENGVTSDSGNDNGKTSNSATGENSSAGAESDEKSSDDKNQDGKPNGGDAGENGVENGGGNAEGNANGNAGENAEDKNDNGEDKKDADDAGEIATHDADGGHRHCVCGKNHQDIGDHNGVEERTFSAWTEKTSLPTDEGSYYLTEDVTISSNVELNANVTLCLHGKTVTVSNGAAIKINGGGTLTLTDCADTQGTIRGSGQPGIEITGNKVGDTINYASFLMYGGTITGFAVAVRVGNHGDFTLCGGKITKNNTGAAAAVSGKAGRGATAFITMYGGEISGNTGEAGGGVYVGEWCTFELKGGKISNNTASGHTQIVSGKSSLNGGGGVYLDHLGSFKMAGGEISNNTATAGNGGGVCVMALTTGGSISITGGEITNNTAKDGAGGGVYGGPLRLTIENTKITDNTCSGNGGGVYAEGALTLKNVEITGNKANTGGGKNGGGVYISKDRDDTEAALTVSGNTSISDNTPNNYYAYQSNLLPVKVSGALDENARIGICLERIYSDDEKFLPTTTSDSVVATAEENVALSAGNFTADNSDYVVRTDTSEGVKFGLCDHDVPEGKDECEICHTKFVAVLAPEGEGAKKEYFRDLNGAEIDGKTGTLKLFQNVAFSKTVSITRSTLTLDLNGHTIEKANGAFSPIRLGSPNNSTDSVSVLTVIDSKENTNDRTLDAEFTVNARSALNLYDGVNAQGFQGTVTSVKLTRTGKLVSCGGRIETLWLTDEGADWDVRLWQSNTQYCTVGTIQYRVDGKTITVSEFLSKNHPGAMLYGAKSGGTEAEKISGVTTIDEKGVDGAGGYTNVYIQTCEKHEPKSDTEMVCTKCGAELAAQAYAEPASGESYTKYFTVNSTDTTRWVDGYTEAVDQLAAWTAAGCTNAKLTLCRNVPMYYNYDTEQRELRTLTLGGTMMLVGENAGTAYVVPCAIVVPDKANVTFTGGTYTDTLTVKAGGKATFAGGNFKCAVKMYGAATIQAGAVFQPADDRYKVEVSGTLTVEGGTLTTPVEVYYNGCLNASGGTFEKVKITYSRNSTTLSTLSGGTFGELTLSSTLRKLTDLLATGCAYYQDNTIVSVDGTVLQNVTVKSGHKHSINEMTGQCTGCGAYMAAAVKIGDGAWVFYTKRADAMAALEDAQGEKALKFFRDQEKTTGDKYAVEPYTLTSGPVTLDLNGKSLPGVNLTVQAGVELAICSDETAEVRGKVNTVQATGKGAKVIVSSSKVEVGAISAQHDARLELGGGYYNNLYVVDDGSSAALSGGTYDPHSYSIGGGPGSSAQYVSAPNLLAPGYGYKATKTGKWDIGSSLDTSGTYTVEYTGVAFEGIYPDNEKNFSDNTYLIRLTEATTTALKLTAKSSKDDQMECYGWLVYCQGSWLRASANQMNGKGMGTYPESDKTGSLTVSDLPVGRYQFKFWYALKDSDGNVFYSGYSEALTVVVTKHTHSWTYTAEGATITAKCTADGCYLDGKSGGSVTVHAPERKVYEDGKDKAATVVWSSDWVADAAQDTVKANYTGTIANGNTYNGGISAPADAGEYTASITVGGETAKVKYTIGKATLTVEGTAVAEKAYEVGLRVHNIDITGLIVKRGETVVEGTWKFDQNFSELNVGDTTAYTATFTPESPSEAGNYETLTTSIVPNITKGPYDRAKFEETMNVMTDEARTGVEVSETPNVKGVAIVSVTVTDDQDHIIRYLRHEAGKVIFDVAKADAGKTATITVTYSSDNYNDFTGTIKVKTVTKERATVRIEGMPESLTYGDIFTLTATQTGDTAQKNSAWTWDFDTNYFKLVGGSNANSAGVTLQAVKAGTPSKPITVTYASETHKGSADVPVGEVGKKVLTEEDLMHNGNVSKVYDGTTSAPVDLKVSVRPEALVGNDTLDITGTLVYNSANVDEANTITFISDAITSDNYQLAVGTVLTISAYIRPAPLTVEGTGTASGVYGKKLSELDVSGLTAKLNGTTVAGTWRLTGDTIPDVGDAGTYTATFTPESGANNYNVLTKSGVKLAISKATYGGEAIAVAKDVPANKAQTGVEVDMTEALKGFKGAQVKSAAIDGNNDGVLTGTPDVVGGMVRFDVASVAAGKTATIRVTIQCTNYEGVTAVITVKTVAQQSGGGYYYKSAAGGAAEAEKSPGTGDAGLLVYGLTALGGYTGAALVLRRRKREE